MDAKPSTPYEVVCQHCRVSFPVGTRQCMHCGRPINPGAVRASMRMPRIGDPKGTPEEVVIGEDSRRRGGLSPVTMIWIALLLAGYVYRACTS